MQRRYDTLKLHGDKIQAARKAMRIPMSGVELARLIGVTPRCVSAIETGRSTKKSTAEKIAKEIRIKLEDLIVREG